MTPIKVLMNADEAIEALSSAGPLSPAELAERLGMPRPSVYRLLDGLEAIGLTRFTETGTAALGLRWLHLADDARAAMREWTGARDVLAGLVARTAQTAFLSVLRGDEAICLDWEQGRAIGVLVLRPGGSLPLHAGAAGRTLLAFAADADAYLAGGVPHRYTAKTIVDAKALAADAARTRERGYALSIGDVTDGIAAIGVPVRDAAGTVRAALSLAGISEEILDEENSIVRELKAAAARLSGGLAAA